MERVVADLVRKHSLVVEIGLDPAYLSVRADSKEELQERSERVRALCASLLLHTVPTSFRAAPLSPPSR